MERKKNNDPVATTLKTVGGYSVLLPIIAAVISVVGVWYRLGEVEKKVDIIYEHFVLKGINAPTVLSPQKSFPQPMQKNEKTVYLNAVMPINDIRVKPLVRWYNK